MSIGLAQAGTNRTQEKLNKEKQNKDLKLNQPAIDSSSRASV